MESHLEFSDHNALERLRANNANKIFASRLTRWVDRLLPFALPLYILLEEQ